MSNPYTYVLDQGDEFAELSGHRLDMQAAVRELNRLHAAVEHYRQQTEMVNALFEAASLPRVLAHPVDDVVPDLRLDDVSRFIYRHAFVGGCKGGCRAASSPGVD